jgi:hypothetical protein
MASDQSPLDTAQPKQAQRNTALKIIPEKFGGAKVKVLDPQKVLQDYDATSAKFRARPSRLLGLKCRSDLVC